MEIITVKDASGATLEKNTVRTVTIDVLTGAITLQGDHAIVRKDGKEITTSTMGGFNVQPATSTMPSNPALPAEDITAIMESKLDFLTELEAMLTSKAQITA